MSEENFTVFETNVDEKTFEAFVSINHLIDDDSGRLTDIQKEVLERRAKGMKYNQIIDDLDFNYQGSVQAGTKGGIDNIIDALADLIWLFKRPDILEFIVNETG